MSSTPDTVWYENTEQHTFHEVVKGTDVERHLKRQYHLKDPDDENSLVPSYRQVDEKVALRNPERQPGYVAPPEPVKSDEEVAAEREAAQAEEDARIQERIDAAVRAALAAQK